MIATTVSRFCSDHKLWNRQTFPKVIRASTGERIYGVGSDKSRGESGAKYHLFLGPHGPIAEGVASNEDLLVYLED